MKKQYYLNLFYINYLYNIKFKNKLAFGLISILVASVMFLIGYKQRDNLIMSNTTTISALQEDTFALNQNLREYELDLVAYNEIMEDKDYLRYMAFKHSDIVIPKNFNHDDLKLIYRLSIEFKIPQRYIYRLIQKESRFKPGLTSSKGAKGYMQIMPGTFKSLKNKYVANYGSIEKYSTNQQNIIVGTYYLKYLWDKYNNWDLVFASYNAGAGNVEKAGNRVPNFSETKNYVKFITKKAA